MTVDDDISEIEQELGTNPSGVYDTVRARLDILEARINNPLAPSPDVENPFIIGGTGVTISTGTGYPTEDRVDGSIYLRQDGYGIYSRINGQWDSIQNLGNIVFDDVDTMSNTDTTYFSNGFEVTVNFPRHMSCVLDKNSIITPDNLRYFTASPTGVWIRDISIGCPGANEVAEWFVSPSGDDNNDGLTDLTPLQTIEEFQYRIGRQSIDGSTVGVAFVNILGDYSDGREYSFNFNFIHSGALAFLGQKVLHATYTVSAVTPWNENTGVIGAYSLTGAPNLSSYVGMFARISVSTNPSAVGRKTLIVNTPSTGVFNGNFIDQGSLQIAEPIVGDTIQIYMPTKIGGNIIINSNPIVFNSGGGVFFQDLDLGIIDSDHSTTIGSGVASFIACILRGCDIEPGVNMCQLSLCATYDLRAYGYLTMYGTIMQSGGGSLLAVRGGAVANSYTRSWVYGGGISVGHNVDGNGTLNTQDTFVISSAGNIPGTDVVMVTSNSLLLISDKFLQINNGTTAIGFHVRPGGGVYYPTVTLPLFAGTTPTIKFKIGSTVTSSLGSGIRDTNSRAEMVPVDP
jgi:hypothetical protein